MQKRERLVGQFSEFGELKIVELRISIDQEFDAVIVESCTQCQRIDKIEESS